MNEVNIDLFRYFVSPICTTTLPTIDNAALAAYAQDRRQNDKGRTISNAGGWQSGDLPAHESVLAPLVREVNAVLAMLHEKLGFRKGLRHGIVNYWLNINPPDAHNVVHAHANSVLSGAYYVESDPDTSGHLVLLSPTNVEYHLDPAHVAELNSFTASTYAIAPKPSLLVIFPSWLKHYVAPNRGTADRISISFNTQIGNLL